MRENVRQKLAERSERIPRERDLASMLGIKKDSQANARGNSFQSRIFVLSAAQGNVEAKDDTFLSSRYAPFGRLLDCKLVNTLESNVDGTPLIAIVIKDLWWTNAQGERKLIIPAGTEVHGIPGGKHGIHRLVVQKRRFRETALRHQLHKRERR